MADQGTYVLRYTETVSVHSRIFEVKLLVEVEVESFANLAVFCVESVADARKLVRERLQTCVVVGLDDEIVVLELFEVQRLLHHLRVFGQRPVEFLKGKVFKQHDTVKRSELTLSFAR